jgi:HEAT repeat protein
MKHSPLRLALLFVVAVTLLGPAQRNAAAPPEDEVMIQGKPLGYWVERLKEDRVKDREESLDVLAQGGAAAKPALPAVRALLKDQPLSVRFRAALAVWKIGGDAPAMPLLLDALAEPDSLLRLRAAETLAVLGPAAEAAAPALVQCLADKDANVRRAAAVALEQIDRAGVAALIKGAGPASAVRRESIDVLARLGSRAGDAVPALTAALKDDDLKTRTAAAAALWRVDATNTAGVFVLIEGSASTDGSVSRQALEILLAMRPRPKEAAGAFAEALKSTDGVIRIRAAEALWDLDGKPDEVLPTLTEALLKYIDPKASPRAWELLRRMGPKAKPLLPKLVESLGVVTPGYAEAFLALGPEAMAAAVKALEEKPGAAKAGAAEILGAAGPYAVEPLRKLAAHDDAVVRSYAVYALGRIGAAAPDKVLPLLAEALKDKDRSVRLRALTAYRLYLSPAPDAPAAILEMVQDKDAELAVNAVVTLERLRLDPATALPVLKELAAKNEFTIPCIRAAALCSRLEPKKHPAADVVKAMMKGNEHSVAADFVARTRDPDALAVLVRCLSTEHPRVCDKILDTVDGFGPDAKPARPALVEAMNDRLAKDRLPPALALLLTGDVETAMPVLAGLIKNNAIHVFYLERLHAALRKLGPDAKAALPALKQVAIAPGHGVTVYRFHCLWTLAIIDPTEKDASVAALTE